VKAVAEAELAVNLVVLVPLTENMPGGRATKPGDVVRAMNGKTIQVRVFGGKVPLVHFVNIGVIKYHKNFYSIIN
jgi:hypothetical protein